VIDQAALLDSDTTSELARGHPVVTRRSRAYLELHGRFTLSAVTVFERLRGYRAAIRQGKPFENQLRQFEAFAATCFVLPIDSRVADVAVTIWAGITARRRRALGDILIAATASASDLPLVTRNRRDFEAIAAVVDLRMLDWSR
jgi:predicted nucleic acid-binding protein